MSAAEYAASLRLLEKVLRCRLEVHLLVRQGKWAHLLEIRISFLISGGRSGQVLSSTFVMSYFVGEHEVIDLAAAAECLGKKYGLFFCRI